MCQENKANFIKSDLFKRSGVLLSQRERASATKGEGVCNKQAPCGARRDENRAE
jgi:hypothetical protein